MEDFIEEILFFLILGLCRGLRCGARICHVMWSVQGSMSLCHNGCCNCGYGGGQIGGGVLDVISCAALVVVMEVVDKVNWAVLLP